VPRLAIHTASRQSARFNDSPNNLWRYRLILVLAHGQYSAHSLEDFHLASFLNQRAVERPTCEIWIIARRRTSFSLAMILSRKFLIPA
jgi:hypothetical protein